MLVAVNYLVPVGVVDFVRTTTKEISIFLHSKAGSVAPSDDHGVELAAGLIDVLGPHATRRRFSFRRA